MMQVDTKQNFTTTFSVDRTPQEAFEAITNVRGWWSEDAEGVTDRVGGEFVHRYQDVHRCTIRVTELVPGRKVAWLVLDNYFNFIEDQAEWKGTEIVFEISEKDGGAEVRFTHVGLVPQYECYDVCSNAWGGYIGGSLRNLINTGVGQPNPKEGGNAPAHQDAASVLRAERSPHAVTLKPGSILLGTTRPAELRDWYRRTLAPEYKGEGPIDLGGFLLVIDKRDDLGTKNNEPGRMILNFHVEDFGAVEAQLRAAGVDWLVPVADRPSGRFGTFADPDGNYLQIIQFK
ncbi:SRPBCC domain-containing protein [Nocardia sp. NBC_00403]|uniref:SRPBCC domain-containing protein n=1 Tax=Nocardia sp. NBC_00403 TaxID=2975990 RepID=UPI002E1C8B98